MEVGISPKFLKHDMLIGMFDARIFIDSLDEAAAILGREHAVFKGDYTVIDKIYQSIDPEQTLERVFLRLRLVPKNIWDEGDVIVAIKNTEIKTVGKVSAIPFRKEFDTKAQAEQFIRDNYADQFEFLFKFSRDGKQYFIGEDGVDLEWGDNYCSIEFKSKTAQGLQNLLDLFHIHPDQVIKGPSVIAIRDLVLRK